MSEISVLTVDAHPIVREAVCALLRSRLSFRVAADAHSMNDALLKVHRFRPDLVVQELNLGGDAEGARLCQSIKELPWQTRVVMYTANVSFDGVVAALSAGADSYLHKSVEVDVLVESIVRTHAGERLWLLGEGHGSSAEPCPIEAVDSPAITQREKEVLGLLLRRYSNEEIARELTLAQQTVKNHVSSVLRKLGVRSRRDLFRAIATASR